MAVIKKMPGLAIINGFKGTLDFYYWKGICVVRKWPRSPGHFRTPAVEAQWPAWRAASHLWNELSPAIKQHYRDMAQSSNLTGRDMFTKGYLSPFYVDLS